MSFVIPAYNESGHIAGCLGTIAAKCAAIALPHEVIVVDNGSTDDTAAIARCMGSSVISIQRSSVAHGRNVGARASRSDLIAFIDADVLVTDEWLAAMGKLLRAPRSELLVTGYQCVVREDGDWLETCWFARLTDRFLGSANIVVSRSAFELVDGFDPFLRTGEDYDFCQRLINAGADYRPDPGFRAIHLGYPRTVSAFVKREMWHCEGDLQTIGHMIRSPVVLLSTAYLAAHLVFFGLLIFKQWTFAIAFVTALAILNLVLAGIRTRTLRPSLLLGAGIANYLYFVARGISIIRRIGGSK